MGSELSGELTSGKWRYPEGQLQQANKQMETRTHLSLPRRRRANCQLTAWPERLNGEHRHRIDHRRRVVHREKSASFAQSTAAERGEERSSLEVWRFWGHRAIPSGTFGLIIVCVRSLASLFRVAVGIRTGAQWMAINIDIVVC